ncbi:MAG: histidine phosphatase family protein [Pedobacter sp.]|nr:histidine phosphatase family protein [Pedobacter sp.]MDQ8053263.1 histidine phosphatase family protein [Pedobacter sp.]
MKQLVLIRHAKSDWGSLELDDFDRPLNKRGKANAPDMGERLAKQQIIPDLIVSSPALRAITTANFFANAWEMPSSGIKKEPKIYEASAKTLLGIINNFDNQYDRIALFGHNPGLTDLVNYLDGHLSNLPTCGVVMLEFPFEDWAMVSADSGKILLYDYPKSEGDLD